MSNLIRRVMNSPKEETHNGGMGSGTFTLEATKTESSVEGYEEISTKLLKIEFSGKYSDLAQNPERHFSGRLSLKDSKGQALDDQTSIVLISVGIVYVSTNLDLDVEFWVPGCDMPMFIGKNGTRSINYVPLDAPKDSEMRTIEKTAPSDVHQPFQMITRYIETPSYNAGQAYGFSYNELRVQVLACQNTSVVLVPKNYQYYSLLFHVTEDLLQRKNGREKDHLTFAIMSRQDDNYWKVEKSILKATTSYIEQNLTSAFRPIKLEQLRWKLSRFTEKPWIAELPEGFDSKANVHFEAMIYTSFVIPKK